MKKSLVVILLVLSSFFAFLGVSRGECIFIRHVNENSDDYYDSSSVRYSGDIVTCDVYVHMKNIDETTCQKRGANPSIFQIDCAKGLVRMYFFGQWTKWSEVDSQTSQILRTKLCR
jgi:hypothetical protein